MRTIKFRAWDKKDKKYLYSEKQEFICTTHSTGLGVTIPYANADGNPYTDEECFDWADADLIMGRYELEQFTGLYDKNGKEVYENDILFNVDENIIVVWFQGWAQFACESPKDFLKGERYFYCEIPDSYSIEVIGNIHESNMEEMLNEFD